MILIFRIRSISRGNTFPSWYDGITFSICTRVASSISNIVISSSGEVKRTRYFFPDRWDWVVHTLIVVWSIRVKVWKDSEGVLSGDCVFVRAMLVLYTLCEPLRRVKVYQSRRETRHVQGSQGKGVYYFDRRHDFLRCRKARGIREVNSMTWAYKRKVRLLKKITEHLLSEVKG